MPVETHRVFLKEKYSHGEENAVMATPDWKPMARALRSPDLSGRPEKVV
jgi:hypothetical protein